jgi:hypothetical protein
MCMDQILFLDHAIEISYIWIVCVIWSLEEDCRLEHPKILVSFPFVFQLYVYRNSVPYWISLVVVKHERHQIACYWAEEKSHNKTVNFEHSPKKKIQKTNHIPTHNQHHQLLTFLQLKQQLFVDSMICFYWLHLLPNEPFPKMLMVNVSNHIPLKHKEQMKSGKWSERTIWSFSSIFLSSSRFCRQERERVSK